MTITAANNSADLGNVAAPIRFTGHALEDMVRAHLPLVGHLVRQVQSRLPSYVSREDLVSAGMAALAAAARSFEPERGIPFASFATNRIRGALLDELRGMDWASRSVRSRARQVETIQQQLTAALARTPTKHELADALGMTLDELKSVDDDVHRASILSLQGFAGTADDMVSERTAGPEELLLHRERVGYLHHAVQALPERLQTVINGYFFQERPMIDIAAELEVTESRVSQLRAEALGLLRDGLNTHLDPDLVANSDRPQGCVQRRREAYYHQIGTDSTIRSRLAHTNHHGMSFAHAGRRN